MQINKKFELISDFSIEKSSESIDEVTGELRIVGYANTTAKDRVGDVVAMEAWTKGGLNSYKQNPIILAYHNHSRPIGVAESLSVDERGLKITARISTAAEEIYQLIKEGVLKAFSIGFQVKDADYDSTTDIFVIKDLELLEVSVVSVPANQDSLFSVSKGFDSEADYLEFKKSFNPPEENLEEIAKEQDNQELPEEKPKEEEFMDKEELQKMIAEATSAAVTKGIEVGQSGAEKLLADAEKRVKDAELAGATNLKALDDLRAALAEKATEIEALQKSKMQFDEKATGEKITYAEKEMAVLLAKATNKRVEETSLFRNIVQKYNAGISTHVPSATWEIDVSNTMQDEIRRSLTIDPIFSKQIQMVNPVMMLPVNPEAGYANWVVEANFKAATSSGTAQAHKLKEITMNAYKLATKEFLGTEEEDDSLIPLLPLIRDAIVRRTAKAWDLALLRGAGAGADPIKGIITYAAGGEIIAGGAGLAKATVQKMLDMRRALGTRGLVPSDLIYVVSNDVYYDLLDDTSFQTMDKVGMKATLLTGQVGTIANTPVVLSGEFEAKAATKIGAVVVNQNNFLVGRYKGLRIESDYSVENQQRLIVASQRVGFQQITSVEGNGVATFRWTA